MDSGIVTVEDGPLWRWLDVPGPSELPLSDDESVRGTWPCNHAENCRIARGARLFLILSAVPSWNDSTPRGYRTVP